MLGEVLEDWELLIKENSATILSENLPVIEGSVESQLRELFSNLFSNALKFKNINKKPVVKVESEVVNNIDISNT